MHVVPSCSEENSTVAVRMAVPQHPASALWPVTSHFNQLELIFLGGRMGASMLHRWEEGRQGTAQGVSEDASVPSPSVFLQNRQPSPASGPSFAPISDPPACASPSPTAVRVPTWTGALWALGWALSRQRPSQQVDFFSHCADENKCLEGR